MPPHPASLPLPPPTHTHTQKVPTPAARYSAGSDGSAGGLVIGEGCFHLHVAEVNAIVQI